MMMKICFLAHNLNQDNGGGVLSLRLINGLRQSNQDVIALTSEISGENYEMVLLPDLRRIILNFFKIRNIFKNHDVIHALDAFPYGVIAAFYSIGLGKKIIITAVGTGAIGGLYHPFYSWLLKYAYRRADKIVAISNFTKNEILKKVKGLDIKVVSPGVDFEKFGNFEDVKGGNLKPFILSVGALRWRKGYKQSIKAFAEISKKFPDLKYVIAGKRFTDKYFGQLQVLIKELGLEEKVLIYPDASEEFILELYRGAELFCLLSQTLGRDMEGFGIVFLEAAAARLPVVGSNESGVEDAVLDGVNGILVGPRDIMGFATAIVKILSDPELKKRMSEASLEFAKKSGWSEKIQEYTEIYSQLK